MYLVDGLTRKLFITWYDVSNFTFYYVRNTNFIVKQKITYYDVKTSRSRLLCYDLKKGQKPVIN